MISPSSEKHIQQHLLARTLPSSKCVYELQRQRQRQRERSFNLELTVNEL